MTHVATFICAPHAPRLTGHLLRQAGAALPRAAQCIWLDNGVAADIAFAPAIADNLRELTAAVRDRLDGAAVDVVLQPARARRKRLLAADMDSTMIMQECIDELAAAVGRKAAVAAVTARAMRGELAFETSLRERVALVAGLHRDEIAGFFEKAVTVTPGARTLVRTMRRAGARTALLSGGFAIIAKQVADAIGFEESFANELAFDDAGRLTGVVEPLLGDAAKRDRLRALRDASGLAAEETLAVGDGANDLLMLHEAGLGVAFRGKPAVVAAAPARIDHGDLTALLYIQGYPRGAFAEDEGECGRPGWMP